MHTLSNICCKKCGISSSVTPLYWNEGVRLYVCADCEDMLAEECEERWWDEEEDELKQYQDELERYFEET